MNGACRISEIESDRQMASTVSIITTCRNAAPFIAQAVTSIQKQTAEVHIQHVIADGASTDNTLAVVRAQTETARVALIIDSRRDGGIYHGMNRALSLATGDIIGILNADDIMEPHAVASALDMFERNPDAELVTFGAVYFDEASGRIVRTATPARLMTQEGLAFGLPAINSRFFRRSAFERFGLFRQEFPLAADRIWLMQAAQNGIREAVGPQTVYRYRIHGGSASMRNDRATRQRLRLEHVAMARWMLEVGQGEDMRRACLRFGALEGVKSLLAGASWRKIVTELRALDRHWQFSALLGCGPWLRWRGKHSNAA